MRTLWRRHALPWRALRARPRLLAAMAFGVVAYVAAQLVLPFGTATNILVAWNAGALLYLVLAREQMVTASLAMIQQRSLAQDEGRVAILVLVVVGALAVLLAVGSQIGFAKTLHGHARIGHLALAGCTVISAWTVTQVMFALHYAHEFYNARHRRLPDPLQFPGTKEPVYADFLYFACVIGTSGQTSDVSFTSSSLRAVGTLHCVEAFFFNAALLGLTINVLAGLL